MQKIVDIINEIRVLASSNDKKIVLEKHKDDLDWIKFLKYVYDEVVYVYNKTKLPDIKYKDIQSETSEHNEMLVMYNLLDAMCSGDCTGKRADAAIQEFLETRAPKYTELFSLILKRDIKARMGANTVNDVYGDIITIPEYMRCEKEDKLDARIKYPCIVQTKEDGLFLNNSVFKKNDNSEKIVEVTTRQGFNLNPLPELFRYIADFFKIESKGIVFHGEALVMDEDGNYMPRAEGNGLINSYVQQATTRKTKEIEINEAKSIKARDKKIAELKVMETKWKYTADNIVYVVWDIVDRNDWKKKYCKIHYIDRFKLLQTLVNYWHMHHEQYTDNLNLKNRLLLVKSQIANSKEEVLEIYADMLAKGQEGVVVKNFDLIWEHGVTTSGMIKLKDFKECDLLIVGWTSGKPNTQFEEGVGSLMCESSDGLVQVDISGLTMKQRGFERVDEDDSAKGIKLIDGFDPNDYIRKIAATKFNEVTTKKGTNIRSLSLPSIMEIRSTTDKTQADDLKYILEQ